MNFSRFISHRIALNNNQSFSKFIVRIAIASVAISIAVMIITASLINGFQHTISNKIFGFWAHVHVLDWSFGSDLAENPVYRYEPFYVNADQYPEIEHVQVTAVRAGIIQTDEDIEGVMLKGIGHDFRWDHFSTFIVDGDIPTITEHKKNKALLLSETTSNRLQLSVGDEVFVSFIDQKPILKKFTISGIYNSGISEFDQQYAICDIAVIQQINNWPSDSVGGFEIFLSPDQIFSSRLKTYSILLSNALFPDTWFSEWKQDPLDRIGEELYYSIPNLDVKTIRQIWPGIFDWLHLQTANEVIILVLMVIIATFNMITALLILIIERTRMIGTLKALGSSNKQIRSIFMWNGAYIIFAGLLIGNAIGLGLCAFQEYTHFITLPEDSYYISFAPIQIDWMWIGLLNAFSFIVCTCFLWFPTMMVNRIEPVRAIRFT